MSIKSLALAIAKAFLDFILKPVLRLGWRTYYFSLDHTKPLPKTDNPLLFMPAWQLAQKIRKREVVFSIYLSLSTNIFNLHDVI